MPSVTAAKAKKANANASLKSRVSKAPAVIEEVNDHSENSEDEPDFGSESDVEDESGGSGEGEEDKDDDEHDSEEGVPDEDGDENQSAGSGSDSDSDSDSLDSNAPRKRRRTSPTIDDIVAQIEDEEEGTPVAPVKPVFNNVPSRIKKKQPEAPKTEKTEETTPTVPVPDPASTVSVPIDANTTFDALNVRPWLVQSLANMAIKRPTGIQKGCIPEILKGRDCIGGSRTGSGKTVAFAVPILQQWAANPSAIFGLILTPTRELALQIMEQVIALSQPHVLKAVLITGGSDMRKQAIDLANRPHLVIATPGRLADHIRTSGEDTICGLRRVKFIVLDEADRLLANSGKGSMLPDVEECFSVLPPPSERQTLLFTATMTPEVKALSERPPIPGRAPVFVCEVDTQRLAIPATLRQMHLQVPVTHREHYLHMFLLTPQNVDKSVIIFCNRTSTADFLHHLLRLLDHRVTSLHSKLPQSQRIDNLGRFRASAARILVATDVAARGLDIPEVKIVVNYDIPRDPDDYIHRVGRTARAGRKGDAVTFVGQRDVDLVLAIEQRVGRQMEAWTEEGVNLETRVIREALKVVGEKKREALLEIEEQKEVGGKRKRGKEKLRAM
ncbi:P-loop containing nucleoside triphosphate hydrolase protein [Pseudoneurospora amorphoporcata]|uniref:P-loop containing nucleoside triphosphate hydrolase protein n=1 Tax=Pseudoneurospora amorphoporcata TaxID=241081 RepID=A0AAN6SKE5_9PEZI|nr:P-loop containing nucleoside triphosphate hydrolase protein [Pseudoneurospora amorphoporcata]